MPWSNFKKIKLSSRGQIALTAVLIILAVALIVATSLGLLGIGELNISFQQSQSERSLAMADACLDEALIRLRRDSDYAGGNLTLDSQTCIIEVQITAPDSRQVTTRAEVNDQVRKVEADLDLTAEGLIVNAWREVP